MLNESYPAVRQEHALGCAVACVASRCGISYREALRLFDRPESAWTIGYNCQEIIDSLAKVGLRYRYSAFDREGDARWLEQPGTIVFVGPSALYPAGHYLVRTQKGWMNSWKNFPDMVPIQASFQEELPGEPAFLLTPATPEA